MKNKMNLKDKERVWILNDFKEPQLAEVWFFNRFIPGDSRYDIGGYMFSLNKYIPMYHDFEECPEKFISRVKPL